MTNDSPTVDPARDRRAIYIFIAIMAVALVVGGFIGVARKRMRAEQLKNPQELPR